MNHSEPNALIHESSPYLLQHAYNPVQWEGWHDATLEHAQKSGKLLLVSIGYAACHWCHVMEHECFEDPEVADVMNVHFIPVKVDREEVVDGRNRIYYKLTEHGTDTLVEQAQSRQRSATVALDRLSPGTAFGGLT